jgi:putative addiction module component (TIGR02574 family)
MSSAAEKILEDAMRLPESDRRVVALCLLDSVGDDPPADVEQAWIDEARRRMAEIKSGAAGAVPWSEARQRIFDRTR